MMWEGYDTDSPVGDNLLLLSGTVQCLYSALHKSPFTSPNIETKNLWCRIPHEEP